MTNNSYADILLLGPTGVGKSTLINTIFNTTVAVEGTWGGGKSQTITIYKNEDLKYRVIDTKGLELDRKQQQDTIRQVTLNGDLKPSDITEKRFKPVWWLCPVCGHEWQSSPNNRSKGVGCPCCSGRVPKIGVNDLKTKKPEIAAEWNYEKNGDLRPEIFLPGSSKKVWWKCSVCGNEWEAVIGHRTRGNGCPNWRHHKLK